jgi:hypothetical protein
VPRIPLSHRFRLGTNEGFGKPGTSAPTLLSLDEQWSLEVLGDKRTPGLDKETKNSLHLIYVAPTETYLTSRIAIPLQLSATNGDHAQSCSLYAWRIGVHLEIFVSTLTSARYSTITVHVTKSGHELARLI